MSAQRMHPNTGLDNEQRDFADQPLAFWKRTSALVLAKTIERTNSKIPFHPGWHHDFVAALAMVKRAVSRSRWHRILARLDPGLWRSCDNGPDWEPRVLLNGGVAIRNAHRVLGIYLEGGVSVSGAEPAHIRREVRTVLRRGSKTADPRMTLLHHGAKGIAFSQCVPGVCSFRGQSILFTPASLVQDLRVLGSGACRERPEEMLAVRLFEDTVCVYTMYRHSDDADTLVESFPLTRFDLEQTFSTSSLICGGNAWPEFLKYVNDELDQELPYCDIPASLLADIRTVMTSDDPQSWASQLFVSMDEFPPLFGPDPQRPPNAEAGTVLVTNGRRYCLYSFDEEISSTRLARAIASLTLSNARLLQVPAVSQGPPHVRIPYSNLARALEIVRAFRRRLGPVRLVIPHLGLDHRERAGGPQEGNGAWFGFARRDGVRVPAFAGTLNGGQGER